MRKLHWDSSFRRAFRRKARKNPQLQQKIFDVLDLLTKQPSFLRCERKKEGFLHYWATREYYGTLSHNVKAAYVNRRLIGA